MTTRGGEPITVNGRRYAWPDRPLVVVCVDGSEPDFGEVEPTEMLVTLEFHGLGQQTELVFTQENFASVESRDRHEVGWTGCLDRLEKLFK